MPMVSHAERRAAARHFDASSSQSLYALYVVVTARKLAVRQRARYLRLATTAWHRLPPVVAVAGLRVLGLSLCLQEAAGSHVQCEDQVAARAVGLS